MPAVASLLLLTTLVSQAQLPGTSVTPPGATGTDAVGTQSAAQPRSAQADDSNSGSTANERPHAFGIGAAMGFGTAGGGGAFRMFKGRVGVNALVNWYRPPSVVAGYTNGSTFVAAPSLVVMLKPMNLKAAVDLRPYVGGGVSYSRRSFATRAVNGTTASPAVDGIGTQEFGGVELTFQDVKSMTISAEVAHYSLGASTASNPVLEGTNFYLMFHFFLK